MDTQTPTTTSDAPDYGADIPMTLAVRAHSGTSHVPETRGLQERDGYAQTLAADHAALLRLADTDEKQALLVVEFARYRAGYRDRALALLTAKARCVSTMITGGSNFPVRRAQKASGTADARATDLIDYRERALTAISRRLQPQLRPIMAGDGDAVERLRIKLAEAEQLQARMKAVNAAIRKHRRGGLAAQVGALLALGIGEAQARRLLEPDELRRVGFPDYAINNNNANIRRMRERLDQLVAAKSTPATEAQGADGVRMEDAPADNRVRLYYPGKPDVATRDALKRGGFRWAPTLGCWQAYRNSGTLAQARRFAGVADVARVA